jgi:DNA-directed RNA polymerase-3 subunit RPC5
LQVLQKHALLVQGLWAPKSPLLIPEGGESSLARDYVLLLFSKNIVISQSDIPTNLKQKMNVFLDAFSVERSSYNFKGWKLKEPADASFMKLFPEIVDAQKEIWNHIERNIYSCFGGKKGGPREKNAVSKPIMTGTPGKTVSSDKSVTKNASRISSGRKSMSEETREALPRVLPKVFQTHKVCR